MSEKTLPEPPAPNGMGPTVDAASSPTKPPATGATKKVIQKNAQLERESRGCFNIVFYSCIFILMDLWRQICAFGMKYYNDDMYPVPQTELVVLSELGKLVIFFCKMATGGTLCNVNVSLIYLVPSITYAINNNIYFFALHYTTPPVWNILTQLRVVFTALVYRFFFKRKIQGMQWAALALLIGAIVLARFSGLQGGIGDQTSKDNMVMALILAVIGSLIAAAGPIYTEYLFKNDDRSFDEKQLQLYLFGSICAGGLFFAETQAADNEASRISGPPRLVVSLLIVCVIFMVACGISTAFIMKKLDNIVKLYAQALSNIVTAFACMFFFPRQFQFDMLFLVCLVLTIVAIFMYENENLDFASAKQKAARLLDHITKSTLRTILALTACCTIALLVVLFYRLSFSNLIHDSLDDALEATAMRGMTGVGAEASKTNLTAPGKT